MQCPTGSSKQWLLFHMADFTHHITCMHMFLNKTKHVHPCVRYKQFSDNHRLTNFCPVFTQTTGPHSDKHQRQSVVIRRYALLTRRRFRFWKGSSAMLTEFSSIQFN